MEVLRKLVPVYPGGSYFLELNVLTSCIFFGEEQSFSTWDVYINHWESSVKMQIPKSYQSLPIQDLWDGAWESVLEFSMDSNHTLDY